MSDYNNYKMKDSKETIKENLKVLLDMLAKGEFIQAQEKFLHDDVSLVEANSAPKEGKEFCIAAEKDVLAGVAEFVGYEVTDYAVADGVSFYEGVMEYIEKNGNRVRVEQAVVSHWDGGKILKERFYHS